ncbi:T9SS type A sorting domain-containing protein [Flavobacterium myungsuense]|uniref:T9SS type A sorting domain-containing protein n=1 Tax=Flavobacterium myungsuense TaxID=651823 RepID=A0ABW3J363_9FLAO
MKKLLLLTIMLALTNLSYGQVALANESFDGEVFPPTGWTVQNTNATNNWDTDGSSAFVNWIDEVQDESLITPSFSLVGYSSAFLNVTLSLGLEFMVTPNPNGDFLISVSKDGGTTWNQIWVEEDYGVYVDYEELLLHLNLADFVGESDVKVKFQYVAQDADVVSMDDVSITGCKTTDEIGLTEAVTDNAASFIWTDSSDNYDVELGDEGFVQGNGTVTNVSDATISYTTLTSGTGYSFYIKANCGGTSNSGWQGPYTFYTTLSTPADLDYEYGFETATLGSGGWSAPVSTVDNTEVWDISDVTGSEELAQDGSAIASCFGTEGIATNSWLYSRGLNLVEGTTVTIKYYVREFKLTGNGGVSNLVVSIGTDKTIAAQTTIIGTNNNIGAATDAEDAYVLQSYTFNVPSTGVYYLGFNCTSAAQTATNNGALLLDGVSVTIPLSREDFLSSSFEVYPSPASDIITVSNNNNVSVNSISIVDLNGRVLNQSKFNNQSKVQINISNLSAGIYMMNINTVNGIATKKIIKK